MTTFKVICYPRTPVSFTNRGRIEGINKMKIVVPKQKKCVSISLVGRGQANSLVPRVLNPLPISAKQSIDSPNYFGMIGGKLEERLLALPKTSEKKELTR